MTRFLLRALLLSSLAASPAWANDVFHGWSKDGTYLVYESPTHNELVELFFCQSDAAVNPTWPPALNELERLDGSLSCVRFLDPNRAPYQWKNSIVLPAPAFEAQGMALKHELVTDGEEPGFVLEGGGKKQTCAASGLTDDSKLQKAWWHPSGRWLAVLIDGKLRHCKVTLKGAPASAKVDKKKKK